MVKKTVLLSAGALAFDGLGGEVLPSLGFVLKGGEAEILPRSLGFFFPFHEKVMTVVLIFAFSDRESCCVSIAATSWLRKCVSHCVA